MISRVAPLLIGDAMAGAWGGRSKKVRREAHNGQQKYPCRFSSAERDASAPRRVQRVRRSPQVGNSTQEATPMNKFQADCAYAYRRAELLICLT